MIAVAIILLTFSSATNKAIADLGQVEIDDLFYNSGAPSINTEIEKFEFEKVDKILIKNEDLELESLEIADIDLATFGEYESFLNKYYDDNYLPDIPSHKYDDAKDVFNLQHTDTREEIDKKLNAGLRSHVDSYRSRVIEHYMFTKENNFYRNILAISTIKTFCLENNIPLVVQQGPSTIASRHDWARDIGHFGPATHSNISKDIISQLNIHLT